MRVILLCLAMSSAFAGLSGCTSDPNSPAIQAMQPVNACGPGGTSDINACSRSR